MKEPVKFEAIKNEMLPLIEHFGEAHVENMYYEARNILYFIKNVWELPYYVKPDSHAKYGYIQNMSSGKKYRIVGYDETRIFPDEYAEEIVMPFTGNHEILSLNDKRLEWHEEYEWLWASYMDKIKPVVESMNTLQKVTAVWEVVRESMVYDYDHFDANAEERGSLSYPINNLGQYLKDKKGICVHFAGAVGYLVQRLIASGELKGEMRFTRYLGFMPGEDDGDLTGHIVVDYREEGIEYRIDSTKSDPPLEVELE